MHSKILLALLAAALTSIGCSQSVTRTASAKKDSSVLELTVAADGRYVWSDRAWTIEELEARFDAPMAYPHITEIHLLNGTHPSSLPNVLELGQLAAALGVPASYERNGTLVSIKVVRGQDQ